MVDVMVASIVASIVGGVASIVLRETVIEELMRDDELDRSRSSRNSISGEVRAEMRN